MKWRSVPVTLQQQQIHLVQISIALTMSQYTVHIHTQTEGNTMFIMCLTSCSVTCSSCITRNLQLS